METYGCNECNGRFQEAEAWSDAHVVRIGRGQYIGSLLVIGLLFSLALVGLIEWVAD